MHCEAHFRVDIAWGTACFKVCQRLCNGNCNVCPARF